MNSQQQFNHDQSTQVGEEWMSYNSMQFSSSNIYFEQNEEDHNSRDQCSDQDQDDQNENDRNDHNNQNDRQDQEVQQQQQQQNQEDENEYSDSEHGYSSNESGLSQELNAHKPAPNNKLQIFSKIVWIYQDRNEPLADKLFLVLSKNLQIIYGDYVVGFQNASSAIAYLDKNKKQMSAIEQIIQSNKENSQNIPKYLVVCTSDVLDDFAKQISQLNQVYSKCILFRGASYHQNKQFVQCSVKQVYDLIKAISGLEQSLKNIEGSDTLKFHECFNLRFTVNIFGKIESQFQIPSDSFYLDYSQIVQQNQLYGKQGQSNLLKYKKVKKPESHLYQCSFEQNYGQSYLDEKNEQSRNFDKSYKILQGELSKHIELNEKQIEHKVATKILSRNPYIYLQETVVAFILVVSAQNKQLLLEQQEQPHEQFKLQTLAQLDEYIVNLSSESKVVLISSEFQNLYEFVTNSRQVFAWVVCAEGLNYLQTEEQKAEYQARYGARLQQYEKQYMIQKISSLEDQLDSKMQKIQQHIESTL